MARVHSVGPDAVRLKEGDLVIVDYAVSARDDPSVQIVLGTFSGAGPACSILAGDAWRNGVHAQYAALPLENVFILDEDRLIGELGYDVLDLHLIHTCKLQKIILAVWMLNFEQAWFRMEDSQMLRSEPETPSWLLRRPDVLVVQRCWWP